MKTDTGDWRGEEEGRGSLLLFSPSQPTTLCVNDTTQGHHSSLTLNILRHQPHLAKTHEDPQPTGLTHGENSLTSEDSRKKAPPDVLARKIAYQVSRKVLKKSAAFFLFSFSFLSFSFFGSFLFLSFFRCVCQQPEKAQKNDFFPSNLPLSRFGRVLREARSDSN